jgi:hypothetical protein
MIGLAVIALLNLDIIPPIAGVALSFTPIVAFVGVEKERRRFDITPPKTGEALSIALNTIPTLKLLIS